MSLRKEASIASKIWYLRCLVCSHKLVGTNISLIEFQYTLMFFTMSSLITVLGFLNICNNYHSNVLILLGLASEEIHSESIFEVPLSFWVVHDNAVHHQPKGKGPHMLEVVILIPEVHSFDFQLESSSQFDDHAYDWVLHFALFVLLMLLLLLSLLLCPFLRPFFLLLSFVLIMFLHPLLVHFVMHPH